MLYKFNYPASGLVAIETQKFLLWNLLYAILTWGHDSHIKKNIRKIILKLCNFTPGVLPEYKTPIM